MNKVIIFLTTVLLSLPSFADFNCKEDIPDNNRDIDRLVYKEFSKVESFDFLNATWGHLRSNFDEVFDKDDCIEHISISIFKAGGKQLVRFTSNDDSCDGGNVIGLILGYQSRLVAIIDDSQVLCED